jgi:DNA-binding GntR family transcriptional regulator
MMNFEAGILAPLPRTDGRRTAVEVHDVLRQAILSGALPPGAVLSQVRVAQALCVSRTPVREAMRMLQEGGLLSAEPNFRSRVLGFDPEDIASLYIKRVMLESYAVGLTAQAMDAPGLAALREVLEALESDVAHEDFAAWQRLHQQFHVLIGSRVPTALAADLAEMWVRSERYISAYRGQNLVGWWQRGEAEHRAIFDAIAGREPAEAMRLAARHLARTALELLAALAPDHDTTAIRASLRCSIAGAACFQPAGRRADLTLQKVHALIKSE